MHDWKRRREIPWATFCWKHENLFFTVFHLSKLAGYPRYARVPLVMIRIWPLLNSPSNFKIWPHMTFDRGWPWPWPPKTIGESRPTPDASLVKIGAGVFEIWNDLWWPQLNSPANFKIYPQVTFDLGWPWPRPPPPRTIPIRGSRAISGQDRCRGSRVIEEHAYIHTYAATSREL